MQPSSEPLSPTASSSSTDAPDMESNPSDQGAHAAPFTSARHHPLNTSISRANKDTSSATASTSAPRAFKEKNRKTSLPRPFFQPSSSSFASRFEGSPLGDALSYFNTPAMAKVFDSSTAWILYYFVLNLGLTLCRRLSVSSLSFGAHGLTSPGRHQQTTSSSSSSSHFRSQSRGYTVSVVPLAATS